MNKQPSPSLLFRTLICLLPGIFAFFDPAFAQKTVSKPGKKMHYLSDLAGGWELRDHTLYTYDPAGHLTEILNTDSLNNFVDRYTIYNDAYGNDTLTIHSIMVNGTIQDHLSRNKLTYNNLNKVTEKIYQELDNSTGWENKERSRFTFANGLLTEKSFDRYDIATGNWQHINKQINITWNQQHAQISGYTEQLFQNNAWAHGEKFTATFDANGGSVATIEAWVNNNWINNLKITSTHDSLGNEINYLKEYWDNGTWSFYSQDQKPITYDANGNIAEQYSTISCVSCLPTGPHKYVYSNYQTFNISGVKNEIPQEIAATIYPNPTENILNIGLPENSKDIAVQLSYLTGKVIVSHNFKASEQKLLNLENLQPGIYLLTLQTEKGKTVRKIVKN